jgi:hypothetical protein
MLQNAIELKKEATSAPKTGLRREVARLIICGSVRRDLLAKLLKVDDTTLKSWADRFNNEVKHERFSPSEVNTILSFLRDFWEHATSQNQPELKTPNRRYRAQVASLLVNGAVDVHHLAQQLDFPEASLQLWQTQIKNVKPRRYSSRQIELRLRLLSLFRAKLGATTASASVPSKHSRNRTTRKSKPEAIVRDEQLEDPNLTPKQFFELQVVNLSVNGGLPLKLLAERLTIPVAVLKQWRRSCVHKIRHWPLTISEVQAQLHTLEALAKRLGKMWKAPV